MVKQVNNSRLKETSFSTYNLRDAFISDQAEYISTLRDEAIFSNFGIKVLIKIPCDDFGDLNDNNVDEYSNFVDTTWLDTTETVVPKFSEYRQLLSEEGMTADGVDGIYPLEVIIPTKLYVPRNSRLIFTEYDANDNQIQREWVVLGTIQKQLSGSKTYSRILNCVPARQNFFTTSVPSVGKLYFTVNSIKSVIKTTDFAIKGTIWFRSNILNNMKKVYKDTFDENIEIDSDNNDPIPNYEENITIPYYYDDSSSNIIFSSEGHIKGESLPVYSENNESIKILIDTEQNIYQDLKIIVKEVDNLGRIIDFNYNFNKGYTFINSGLLIVGNDKNNPIYINMNCINYHEDIFNETIDVATIEKPKYLTTYSSETIIKSKKIAVSVYS